MGGRCFGVFVLFLLTFVLGSCEESSEEPTSVGPLGDDYKQIFQSMPTLSEYLRKILEDRPEILENNDIKYYQDIQEDDCKGKEEIESIEGEECDEDCTNEEYTGEVFKRNVAEHLINSNTDVTTENVIVNEDKTTVNNNVNNKRLGDRAKSNDKNEIKANKGGRKVTQNKKNAQNFGTNFIGFTDSSKLYLSPEEVEEQAIKTEQAIEDHNKKKNSKR